MKKHRKYKGFTLAELLIVVAIIAVLVAIAIPIFTGQLEKARRAVDIQNARLIQSAITNAYSAGAIEAGSATDKHGNGIWVTLCRNSSSKPESYVVEQLKNGTLFCGANNGVKINGVKATETWTTYNPQVEKLLTDYGLDPNSLKIKSHGGKDGWDWIVIEVGFVGTELKSRIYSGFAGKQASIGTNSEGSTNIEKQIFGEKK